MPFFQVRQRVSPSCQYRLRSAIKVIVAIKMTRNGTTQAWHLTASKRSLNYYDL